MWANAWNRPSSFWPFTKKEISSDSTPAEVFGITVHRYYQLHRTERVKGSIRYGELAFSEIIFAPDSPERLM